MIFLYGCSQPPKPPITKLTKPPTTKLKGIWIPEKINWKEGDFNTCFFPDDSLVVFFSSTQKNKRFNIF